MTNKHPVSIAHDLGALFVGGDWACAHGDFAALRHVARRLAHGAGADLQAQLAELEGTCCHDPVRAAALWTQLKRRLGAH
ncbi:MAG TPA: hypothetical protein VFP84_11705 [Kofleriaceae bacterium]|nr:hypothetical protein [Kofleriaceae bacterium]